MTPRCNGILDDYRADRILVGIALPTGVTFSLIALEQVRRRKGTN